MSDEPVLETPPAAEAAGEENEEQNYRERYEQLQKVLGRQGQELGELRRWQQEQLEAAAAQDPRVAALAPATKTFFERHLRDGQPHEEAMRRAMEDAGALLELSRAVPGLAPETPAEDSMPRDVVAILNEAPVPGVTAEELLPDLATVPAQAWAAQGREVQRTLIGLLAKARLADKMLSGAFDLAGRPPAAAPPAVNVPRPGGAGAADSRTQTLRAQLRAIHPSMTDDQLDAAITRATERGGR